MDRRLPNWVDAFYAHTDGLPSPSLFRKWAGIVTIAGALERKVWITTSMGQLFPHLYVFFVAPPGVGKGIVTNKISDFWEGLDDHHIASTNVSRASLLDDLREADRRFVCHNGAQSILSFNSLKIVANELGVLLPSYENDFMNMLTDIWDAKVVSERKRSKDLKYKLDAPQLNMLAGTTPGFLSNLLPDGAWDQGFMSRTLMVYSGEHILGDLFGEQGAGVVTWKDLDTDIKTISKLSGAMTFTPESSKAITAWHKAGGPPKPEHPKLNHYCSRRTQNLLKLCMIASVSQTNELVVTLDHYQIALDWLLEMESFIPDIFKSMVAGGDGKTIQDAWHFAYQMAMKTNKPVAEHRMIHFLQERTPSHNVMKILEVMERAQILKVQIGDHGKAYQPKPLRQQ